jgi:hypothetical protein
LSIFKKKEKKRKLFFDRFFCLECVGDDWLWTFMKKEKKLQNPI